MLTSGQTNFEHRFEAPSRRKRTRSFHSGATLCLWGVLIALAMGCTEQAEEPEASGSNPQTPHAAAAPSEVAPLVDSAAQALATQASAIFGALPTTAPRAGDAMAATDAEIALGRMLYYDKRLSKNHDIACNSCHLLDAFGIDGEPTSAGHRGQRGGRNSPTVYNAALHISQFWDGREPDVEAQAKGPVLNPIEMAAPSAEHVVAVLKSIPGYGAAFASAFPGASDAVTYDNMAGAIGAFERGLITPGRFDQFLAGKVDALTSQEQEGLATFIGVGCITCHTGSTLGGQLYQKLGLVKPFQTEDKGREEFTGEASDRFFFKVPSLRNIAETGPYFHDGKVAKLEHAVQIMGVHQLGRDLDEAQVANIVAFLGSLTGEIDATYIAKPTLPESGPNTPAPDPS